MAKQGQTTHQGLEGLTAAVKDAANAGPAHVTQLTVTGHTDTVGSDAYNMRLSRRRAESVAAQLEKDGLPSSEIEIVAKGKRDLLVPTKDGVKEPQNRRVAIVYDTAARLLGNVERVVLGKRDEIALVIAATGLACAAMPLVLLHAR